MQRYILRRLLLFIPSLLGVSVVVFVLTRMVPGDITDVYLTLSVGSLASQEEQARMAEQIRHELGLDRPLVVQYLSWMGNVLQGNLGFSFWKRESVAKLLAQRLPVTLEVVFAATLIAILWALPLGILSALKQDMPLDYIVRVWTISGLSLPTFWTGIMVIFILATLFNWLPPLAVSYLWQDPVKNVSQFIWPALVLAYSLGAPLARMARSEALEVIREDYVRTARSKGLAEQAVVMRHVIRNTLPPVLTLLGWYVGRFLSGTVIVETVFNLPGLGTLMLGAIQQRDYEVVGSVVLVIALIFLVLNLALDILYGRIDPRVRLA